MTPDLDQLALDTTERIMALGASDKPVSQLKAMVEAYIRDALGVAALRVKLHAQEIYAEHEVAQPMNATWLSAVDQAAKNAEYVYKDSCNHTLQAIDYMRAVMNSNAPGG